MKGSAFSTVNMKAEAYFDGFSSRNGFLGASNDVLVVFLVFVLHVIGKVGW